MPEIQPPPDWPDKLRDYSQVKNFLNGDSIAVNPDDTPVAWRFIQLFDEPEVQEAYRRLSEGLPRL